MPAYPDEQLVVEALDDSHQAFEQLIKQYQYRVLRTIASIVSDEQAAQDVAQDTFLAAWRNLPKLEAEHKFGGWLNQIAVNLSKRWLRDERKYQEDTDSLEENIVVLDQELRYQRNKLRQRVWDAIDELAEGYREIVILHYISGYSYKEISEMLSIPFSTIVGRLQEARNQLRKEFLDMVTQLQLEIDSTIHKILKEHARQDGVSIEALIIRLVEKYIRDIDKPEVSVRQVWKASQKPTSDSGGAPSPDGRYLSFTHWSEGNLAVRDLTTGEYRDLTDEGTWMGPDQCAGRSIWSHDGKQIAYSWSKCESVDESENYNELRIVGLDGSKPRILYSTAGKERKDIRPHAWSQDGKFILTQFGEEHQAWEIALISVADGSAHILKSLEGAPGPRWRHWNVTKMSLSPDGHYVVYNRSVKEHGGARDIFLLAISSSETEIPLVEHPADDYGPVWTPDGKGIVFVSNRSGAYDLWLMQVVDGKPVGEPQVVKKDIGGILGMGPMGFTREGSLYYGLYSGLGGDSSGDIYIASIDPATGEVLEPPTKAIRRFEGHNYSPAWSPDGKSLAYVSERPSPEGTGRRGVLVIRSEETGEERELYPEVDLADLRWSPDGRSILSRRQYHDKTLHLIDVQTGNATPIVQFNLNDKVTCGSPAWSPDGKAIIYGKRHRTDRSMEHSPSIVMRDLGTGKEKELCQERHGGAGMAVSPDGRQLVFVGAWYQRSLKLMPIEGGESHEIPGSQGMVSGDTRPTWTQDGRYILFEERGKLCRIPTGGASDIYIASIDPATGEVLEPPKKAIRQFEGFNHSPAWSPDGKSLAYVSSRPLRGRRTGRREVLVIRSEETGEERELYPEVPLEGRLLWSPDGRFILCRWSHHLIDVQTGDVTKILQPAPTGNVNPATGNVNLSIGWSTDGKTIFCIRQTQGSRYGHIAHDLKTGKEKELSRLHPEVSIKEGKEVKAASLTDPVDCQQIPLLPPNRGLVLLLVGGGESRERQLLRPQNKEYFVPYFGTVATPDGRHILFGKKKDDQSRMIEICRIPAEGGEPQKLIEVDETARSISVHPDGQRIAFAIGGPQKLLDAVGLTDISVHPDGQRIAFIGVQRRQVEVWAIDNFLPGFTADK